MNINQIIQDIEQILDDNYLFAEIGFYPPENNLFFEVHWGDWKHTHEFLDDLVGNYLTEHSINFILSETVDEDDGSDCYSSTHYFRLLEGVS